VVREAQAEANEQRAQRDRDNVDMAAFLVARTRLAGVDEWQAERVSQIGLEADRRRDEHRGECAAAVQRIRGRGVGAHDRGAGQRLRGRGAEAARARGAAPLEALRAGLDSAGVAVALVDRVIRHALSANQRIIGRPAWLRSGRRW
jgi:hypothetical protein